MPTRRSAIQAALLLALAGSSSLAKRPRLRVGIMDVILGSPSSPEAFAVAKRVGFDGIQVTIGKPIGPNRLVLSDVDLQQRILRASRDHDVAITSTYLDVMHRECLQSSEIARAWVRESIAITKALDAGMVELASFFKCALNGPADIEGLVKALRELAPEAERERVVLGIENTLSAEDNVRILDRVGSSTVKIWYDIGNSTNIGHFDAPGEMRLLGSERICQIHVKDQGYLGTGDVNVKACLEAIHDIDYTGWCVLETAAPTGDKVADAEKNLNILRRIEGALGH